MKWLLLPSEGARLTVWKPRGDEIPIKHAYMMQLEESSKILNRMLISKIVIYYNTVNPRSFNIDHPKITLHGHVHTICIWVTTTEDKFTSF